MSRRDKLIAALESAPRDLARMLQPLSAEAALWRPAPNQWCAADVVAHLAYVEPLFLARMQRIVGEEQPRVSSIVPDESQHDLGQPLDVLLHTFAARRANLIAFLQGCTQADWARRGVREADDLLLTLRDAVQVVVDHDSEHLAQLATLRARLAA
jgi:uncharacterized damage-inducible protein DinB